MAFKSKNLSGKWSSAFINKRPNENFFPFQEKLITRLYPFWDSSFFLGSDRLNLSSCKYQTDWIFIWLWGVGRKGSAAGDTTAVMGEAPKIRAAFRSVPVSQAGAQAGENAAVWHRKHDSNFIPGKKEWENSQIFKWITWLCS